MPEKQITVWGIHAGRTGDADALFLKENVVAIGWDRLGDLRSIAPDREAFKSRLVEAYPNYNPGAVPLAAGQLYRFVHELKVGDLVVYPSKKDRHIHIGSVVAEYGFAPSPDHKYPNARAVAWESKSLPRDVFTPGALHELGSAMSFFQVKTHAEEFLAAFEGKLQAARVEAQTQQLEELAEDESNESDQDENEEIPQDHRRIFTDKLDPPINSLYQEYKDGDLVLDPIFQRRPVWDHARSSKLIESILLEVPIPVFYFAESADGTDEVIDGQQRLRAFFAFLDNEYELRKLKAIKELNGKHFRELDKAQQKLIRNYSVRTITFKKESDENLRFDIFERLNTGAVPLNDQELRNCIYRGKYNELLIQLALDSDYLFLMGLTHPERRMRDVEYVLRFAAFYHATYLKYKPSMASFLNQDMQKFQKASPQELDDLKKAFKNSCALIRSMLGSHAFKRFYRGTEDAADGYWEPKKFNSSLFDILMWGFAASDKNQVMSNLDILNEAYVGLMTQDDVFIESIERSTSSLRSVTYRFDAWRRVLDDVLSTAPKEARGFTLEFKKQLYAEDPTCQICHQHIADLDDAAVDHIEQYWQGGKTEASNGRLSHRFCNWSRPRQERLPA